MTEDLSNFSMFELFKIEAETQADVLTTGLLALERTPSAPDRLESCMRAAHSLKGAARLVGLGVIVDLTHIMEEHFVAGQRGQNRFYKAKIDLLLRGVDVLSSIVDTPEADIDQWTENHRAEIDALVSALKEIDLNGNADQVHDQAVSAPDAPAPELLSSVTSAQAEGTDRVLRVTADNLNRLLGLTSELLVEARWLKPFAQSLLTLKRSQQESSKTISTLREALPQDVLNEQVRAILADIERRTAEGYQILSDRLVDLEMFDRQSENLARRLYETALDCRMRPFADGVRGFPRLVRDLASELGKEAHLEIIGGDTDVDREILERLEAPLGHLLRNAIDHGIEAAETRSAAGKNVAGNIRLEARHSAGMLQISVADDGGGIDIEKLRVSVVDKNLTQADTAAKLSENELLEFLFLPGFTTKQAVTKISGRGAGLDVVQTMLKQVRGIVRVTSQIGKGTRFQLQLPLTLSVVRVLLVEIAGEPYAFPLAHIVRTLKLPRDKIEILEGRQHFNFNGRQIGLIAAGQILGTEQPQSGGNEVSVVLIGDQNDSYGLIVDCFLGERELAVQALDMRLGKIKDISAAAILEDGSSTLIVDTDDMAHSVEKLIASGGHLNKAHQGGDDITGRSRKRVLVVDDSFTVRELERKLLSQYGYEVEVEVDGMDGWNAVRSGKFDLLVTDIDMPRMDGIELVSLIKSDPRLSSLPVMIVSYKDRDEDRQRGLDAGADYYLAKGNFQDEALLHAVVDLIGEATP